MSRTESCAKRYLYITHLSDVARHVYLELYLARDSIISCNEVDRLYPSRAETFAPPSVAPISLLHERENVDAIQSHRGTIERGFTLFHLYRRFRANSGEFSCEFLALAITSRNKYCTMLIYIQRTVTREKTRSPIVRHRLTVDRET